MMGFEAPLALLGLLAASIPFFVHRMRKRELPRIVLPTFALVARAAAQSRRRRTLQDLLLLALRMAIVAAAALAIAAPYVTASVPFGDGRVAALAVVIDDSLSMSRHEGSDSLFAKARQRAALIAATLPPGSEVSFVLAGRPARLMQGASRDLAAVSSALTALPDVATRANDLGAAVALAARELARSHLPARRLLLLSDFAAHAAFDPAVLELDGIAIAAERVGEPERRGNAYIESATAAADPTQPGQTSIAIEARAHGVVANRARVELSRAGVVVAHEDLVFVNGAAHAVLHVPTPDDADDPRARVHLVLDDALEADNDAGLVLTRADSVRVLLVNGDPHPASDRDELRYVTRALSLVPDNVFSLTVRSVDPASFAQTRLASNDVIVLANVPAPDAATAKNLLDYLQKGGGVIVAAGHRVDPAAYNASLSEVLAAHVTGMPAAIDLRFGEADARFLPQGLTGLREARTTRRLAIEPTAETLLSFQDGSPALAARDVGDGRSLLFASTLDADFTDLPLRPGFLPLLVAAIREAAGASGLARSQLTPGETLDLPFAKHAAALEITFPDGHTQRITAKMTAQGEPRSVRFDATAAIGAYRVREARKDDPSQWVARGAFVVGAPLAESDLTQGTLPSPTHAGIHAEASQVHRPFASTVFLLAGLLMLVEGVVRTRRRRG